ncbi:MAG: hypothetical protein KAT17_05915 [Candidatus Aminicenantes bacterium]|nr:hypothetical protein [Candidatus Aminicenantes bacterium]
MKKIKYNIAENKKINFVRFIFFTVIVLMISVLFFLIGFNKLSSETKQMKAEKEELKILKEKLASVSDMTVDYKNKINHIKKGWNKKIKLSNSLISWKSFSVIKILNVLENRLPPEVFIAALSISNDSKSLVNADVVATSFKKLGEFYRKFSNGNLVIKKESLGSGGMVRANLIIGLKDEKD